MRQWDHRVLTVQNGFDCSRWPTAGEVQEALNQAGREGYGIDSVEYLDLTAEEVAVQIIMSREVKTKKDKSREP